MIIDRKTLVCVGDSWTWGSEIVDPKYEIHRGTDFLHTQLGNCPYRLSNTYPGIISKNLGFDEFYNLGACGESNDYIFDITIKWIYENYISKNIDTSNLFFIIGLTSPERIGFEYECEGRITRMMINPSWDVSNLSNEDYYETIKDFWVTYITHFSHKHEYSNRFIKQILYLENLLKNNKIKYLFFNAFYDVSFFINEKTDPTLKSLWNSIDSKFFYGKENFETFNTHIKKVDNKNCMTNDHPSEVGHKIWADELTKYIKENYNL